MCKWYCSQPTHYVTGKTGHVAFDANADRLANFLLWSLQPEGDQFELIGGIRVDGKPGVVSTSLQTMIFRGIML